MLAAFMGFQPFLPQRLISLYHTKKGSLPLRGDRKCRVSTGDSALPSRDELKNTYPEKKVQVQQKLGHIPGKLDISPVLLKYPINRHNLRRPVR